MSCKLTGKSYFVRIYSENEVGVSEEFVENSDVIVKKGFILTFMFIIYFISCLVNVFFLFLVKEVVEKVEEPKEEEKQEEAAAVPEPKVEEPVAEEEVAKEVVEEAAVEVGRRRGMFMVDLYYLCLNVTISTFHVT